MEYYVELTGGDIQAVSILNGGDAQIAAELSGGDVYPSGGGSATLQTKSVSITPTESTQTQQITPDAGFDGLSEVDLTTAAIPASYVGSGVPRKTSDDLTASGATVTAPAGYYENASSKAVASGSATTPATTITANPTLSVSASGLITANVSKTQNITPTVSPGYVNAGTAGTVNVSGAKTQQLATQAAATYHPATTDQTIAGQQYLTGAQTIKGVTTTNLSAANIKKDVVVKIGDSADDDRIVSVTGTYEGGGGTDYLPSALQDTLTSYTSTSVTSIRKYGLAFCTTLTSVSFPNVTTVGNSVFEGCSNLATVSVPNLSVFGQSVFFGCGKIQKIALPGLKKTNGLPLQVFRNCSRMTVCDVGECGSLANQVFWGASVLNVLILRRSDAICVNGGGGLFASTPFDTGGTGGTIYIPKALYDHLGDGTSLDYQNATNWSVVYGRGVITWAQIEGSYYETHYGDDTIIPT